jgi:hypothetical protein
VGTDEEDAPSPLNPPELQEGPWHKFVCVVVVNSWLLGVFGMGICWLHLAVRL